MGDSKLAAPFGPSHLRNTARGTAATTQRHRTSSRVPLGCLTNPPVNLPMRSKTIWFCTTSSRVGHTHNAWPEHDGEGGIRARAATSRGRNGLLDKEHTCGALSFGSTRPSIPSVKHVVLPLPLCACGVA